MPDNSVKYFTLKYPVWDRSIPFLISFFGIGLIIILYRDSKLSLNFSVSLFVVTIIMSFMLFRRFNRIKMIELHTDYILIPPLNLKSVKVEFRDIFCVFESIHQSEHMIFIERKNGELISISNSKMDNDEYNFLLNYLSEKFPKTNLENHFYVERIKLFKSLKYVFALVAILYFVSKIYLK